VPSSGGGAEERRTRKRDGERGARKRDIKRGMRKVKSS